MTKKFDIKMSAFSRKYIYICPIKMFYPYKKDTFGTLFLTIAEIGGDDEDRNA